MSTGNTPKKSGTEPREDASSVETPKDGSEASEGKEDTKKAAGGAKKAPTKARKTPKTARKLPTEGLLVAKTSFLAGNGVRVSRGDIFAKDDEVVTGRENLFAPAGSRLRTR